MTTTTFFLSSLESTRLMPVRSCRIIGSLDLDTGKTAVQAMIDPAIVGQDFGRGDIDSVVLAARHEGVELEDIDSFPCFVFVAVPSQEEENLVTPIRSDELLIIGWGELYRSASDAEQHRVDP